MLSRVANSIYWLNRYIERAENVARFVDVNLNLILDLPNQSMAQWEPLVVVTGDLALFQERYGLPTQEQVIQFLTFDTAYPNSIVSCLYAARENARSIREIISSEMWQEVNAFYFLVQQAAESGQEVDLNQFFQDVKLASHRFAGVMDATMSHNEAWHFGQIGRLLERADKTTRIVDVKYYVLLPSVQDVGTTLDEIQWMELGEGGGQFGLGFIFLLFHPFQVFLDLVQAKQAIPQLLVSGQKHPQGGGGNHPAGGNGDQYRRGARP